MKRIIMPLSLSVLLFCASCGEDHKVHEEKTKFLVTSPLKTDTMITREYVCQIRAIQHIELRALEKGYLKEIFVDEGKFVPKGKLMFQIQPLVYQAELGKAKAEAEYAEVEYAATKALADSNVVAPRELALAKAKLEKAKAELNLMQTRLSFTKIVAPFDGIMDRFNVRLGSLLDEGDLLTTLSDISTLWVYFNVPEAEYLDYKSREKGDALLNVQLRMANQKMFKYPGVVKTVEADFHNETGTIAFRATFPNPERLLRHGETGNIVVNIPLKDAILIPQKATFEVLDQKYVYVVDQDNQLKTRRIHIAAELPDFYAISEGLDVKDKILLEGLRLVNENDKINYEYKNPKEVAKSLKLHAE